MNVRVFRHSSSPGNLLKFQGRLKSEDGTFAARGVFSQGIFIDLKRKLVNASNSKWPGGATDRAAREDFYRAVQKAVDDEADASRR